LKAELLMARVLVAGGWSGPELEPFALARGPGRALNPHFGKTEMEPLWLPTSTYWTLNPNAEGLERYSVLVACLAAGADFELLEHGFEQGEFQCWLQEPTRTVNDVLRVITAAALRSEREKRT
jgi:hypothetical protein